jgi:nitrate reductase (NAD(P)H)
MMHAGAVHHDTTEEFSSLHDDYAYKKLNGESQPNSPDRH